jgi:hypothetical protein
MITLKQLTETIEQEKRESALKKLDELRVSIYKTIDNATSEEELINSMLMIKKEIDKIRIEFSNLLFHKILYLFYDSGFRSPKIEKQVFYSLGLTPKQLLFVIRAKYSEERKITRKFLLKLRSFIGLNDSFVKTLYAIRTKVRGSRGKKDLNIFVVYHSANYIVFDINLAGSFVVKL